METAAVRTAGLPAEAAKPSPPAELEAVARDFEALLVVELLKAARAGGSAAWLGAEDAAADAALGLAEQEFARAIARNGGLGLARMVLQGLENGATRSSSAPPAHTAARP